MVISFQTTADLDIIITRSLRNVSAVNRISTNLSMGRTTVLTVLVIHKQTWMGPSIVQTAKVNK